MTNKYIKKPKIETPERISKYEKFNLRENPFPSNPFLAQHSSDKRVNGSIYETSIRSEEYTQLVENFLSKPQHDLSRNKLGFLMDTSYVGRGNGKTAFLMHLLKKDINNDYCNEISKEENKCFGVRVQPENGGKTKTFDKLIEKTIEEIFSSTILKECIISIYLTAIANRYPDKIEDILKKLEENEEDKYYNILTDSNWLNDNEINLSELMNTINENKFIKELSSEFYNYIIGSKQGRLFYINQLLSAEKIKEYYYQILNKNDKTSFFFNDLIYFFEAANFNGAYIFIDDFERIPDFQSERDRRDFANNLRTYFFDGSSENAKKGFYNLLLVLHAGVPRLIEKAWGDSGMEQRCSLTTSDKKNPEPHQIIFKPLDKNYSNKLVKAYLDEFRISKDKKNETFPFEQSALDKIHSFSQGNVSSILKNCHFILEQALSDNLDNIDQKFIYDYFQKTTINTGTEDDNLLNEAKVNLTEDLND